MRTRLVLLLLACCALVNGAAASPADSTRTGKPARVKTVTLLIGSRVFAEFRDLQTVPMNKEFPVGASDYTARAIQFVPDFAMDQSHKVVSRSNLPRNPAVRVIVKENGVAQDTSWAFAYFPPHFSRRSLLSFRLAHVEFFDAPPISFAMDTTAIADSIRTRKLP